MSGATEQFVTLGLGAEVFAVPVAYVREILDYAKPFGIPDGPAYLLGLTDVRGRGAPTLDLRLKLGLPAVPPDGATRILVVDVPVEDRTLSLGLVADRVIEVISFSESQIEASPDIGVPWRSDYIRGVVRRDAASGKGGFVVIFDLARLLTSQDAAYRSSGHLKPGGRLVSPTITAFKQSPDRGRGLARDMAVRWALEEVGQPYEVRLVTFAEMKAAAHMALQPFGQIPTYEDGDLALFESGAIVLHIAERHQGLLPVEAKARARALTWMFAAVSTVQPPIVEFGMSSLLEHDKPWFAARQPLLEQAVRTRLDQLANRLGEAVWLDGAFSAGDLMMVSVLRRLGASGILNDYPRLLSYVARAEARPAFQRAFADQLAVFQAASEA